MHLSREDFERGYALRREKEVEFGDVDMLRHVNNVRYAFWAESIRSIYLADVIGEDITGRRGMILAKHELVYEAPVRYREPFVLAGRIVRWGTKSFDFETCVWLPRLEQRAFRALASLVAYDYEAERSIEVPAQWKERVAAFEGDQSP